jgi:hypothetical protein
MQRQEISKARLIAIIAVAIAGMIHLLISPSHLAHAPAHGIFFALSGLAQVVWAMVYWRYPSKMTFYAGFALTGGMIVLWLLSQILGAPFAQAPEPLDAGAMSSKLAELIALAALVALSRAHKKAALAWRQLVIAEALGIALVFGLFSYGVGQATEPLFPSLMHVGGDAHDNSDDHHGDEAIKAHGHDNSDGHHDD